MKKTIFIKTLFLLISLLLILLNVNELKAETKALPDLLQPSSIKIGNSKIYISEETSVFIYSRNDLNLLNKFGRKGEGPGEISTSRRGNSSFDIIPGNNIVRIFNRNKLMTFTENGKFLSEKRITSGFVRNFSATGKYYTGRVFTFGRGRNRRNGNQSVTLFDKNLNKVRQIYSFESGLSRASFFKIFSPENIFILRSGNDRIYLNKDKKFKIHVFDTNGKKLKVIELETPIEKIDDKAKFSIREQYKERFGQFWERIKSRFEIADSYPSIKNFIVDKDYIYIQTFKKRKNTNKFIVLDKSGTRIKSVFLPVVWKNAVESYPYDIKDGKLYQLVEDEDEEEWSLNIYKII